MVKFGRGKWCVRLQPSPASPRRVFVARPRAPLRDLGLRSTAGVAEPGYRAMGYVERDAFAAAILVARMEDQTLDQAPVWDDLTGFDGRAAARRGGSRQCGLSVPAVQRRRQAQGRGRSAPSLAARRPGRRGVGTCLGVPRERSQSSQPRLSRGPRRAGRPGRRGASPTNETSTSVPRLL